jgi:hypothetical protein
VVREGSSCGWVVIEDGRASSLFDSARSVFFAFRAGAGRWRARGARRDDAAAIG